MPTTEPHHTVLDIQTRLNVSEGTVLAWIHSGELRAVNVGVKPGKKRARWRISEQALTEFEQLRTSTTTPVAPRTRRRRVDDVIEFYPVGSGK